MCTNNDVDWKELPTLSLADELEQRHRRQNASEAAWLAGLAEFDRRRGWQVLGFRSAAAWLANVARMTMVTAREKLHVARLLEEKLPAVGAALRAGDISYSKARTICLLPNADPDTEAALVAAAVAGTSVADLRRAVAHARDATDPDGADRDACEHYLDGGLWLTRGMENGVLGHVELDAEEGDLLFAAIDSVLAAERAAGNPVVPVDGRPSTTNGTEPVDGCPSTTEPYRSPARRRADALVTLVRGGLDHLETIHPGRTRTELLVIFDADGTAQTASGAPLTGRQAERLACDAALRRVVMAGRSEVLDVGTRTHDFTPAMRAGAFARDRGCRFPGCGRWWGVQLHHVPFASHRGPTSVANGVYLCHPHHRLVHQGHWTVTGDANGILWFKPPDGRPALPSDPPLRTALRFQAEQPTAVLT